VLLFHLMAVLEGARSPAADLANNAVRADDGVPGTTTEFGSDDLGRAGDVCDRPPCFSAIATPHKMGT
jgi:hypothetical protein